MELEEKTVLVTGAGGNVGSAVALRLVREGAKVRALTRTGADRVTGTERVVADLGDEAQVLAAVKGADVVVHCAASLSDDLAECTRGNVDATRNLIAAMHEHRVKRLVHLSTVSVYQRANGPSFEETKALCNDSRDAYAFTKAQAEGLVRAAGLRFTILRPAAVLSAHPNSYWGPRAFARAREYDQPVWPLEKLPFVHVDNLCDAIVLAATKDEAVGRVYNVCEGEADAAKYLERVYAKVKKPVPPLPRGLQERHFPSERLKKELGWAPRDLFKSFLDAL